MKKLTSLLLSLLLVLSLAACNQEAATTTPLTGQESTGEVTQGTTTADSTSADEPEPPAAKAEEVKGVTIPDFAVMVNGVKVDNVMMAASPTYSVAATSVNSAGTESTTTYVGFAMTDVLKAAGLTEDYIWLEATADDGYAITLTGDAVTEPTTLLAVTKNGEQFNSSPWFAPGSSNVTGDYLKGMVSILVNTTESAPEGIDNSMAEKSDSTDEPKGAPELADKTDKVTFADFSFKINGQEVTNSSLEGLRIFKVTASVEKKDGTVSESTYTGYKLIDVLKTLEMTDYSTVKAVANDGYEVELTKEQATSEYTILAIEKDKELGEDGTIWLAPTLETSSNAYAKYVVELIVE